MKISAVLIVKNEKDHIDTVLSSLEGFDEIVVCDTGSSDNTVELAKKYTRQVFTDYVWNDHFAEARNHALKRATGDWVLSIDGDEVLEKGGLEKIKKIIQEATDDQNTFSVRMNGNGHIHYLARLFRNNGKVSWQGRAHETLKPIEKNHVDLTIYYGYSTAHKLDPYRMMRILQKSVDESPESPRELYYLAREYYYRKDYKRAAELLEQYVKNSKWNPEKSDGYLYLARCYFYSFQGDKAREACLRAIQINPDFKEALLFMGELYYSPWKEKWLQFASLATNRGVLFVRNIQTDKPLDMSEMDILCFKNLLAQHKTIDVLEWGGGKSTRYFTKFLKEQKTPYTWEVVEHDKSWYENIKSWDLDNVNVVFAPKDSPEYYNRGCKYDLIFIDGRNRRKCLLKAKELLKEGGIVLLHDADRIYYQCAFEGYEGKFLNPKGSLPRLWQGSLTPKKQLIPRIIHQIWIGKKEAPTAWINTWKEKHPEWEHILWNEEKINSLNLKNRSLYDKYYNEGCFNGCANVARSEILEQFGGVYIDADSECLETMQGASFLDWELFSVHEADNFYVDGIRLVANGIIGCIPHHPIMQKYVEEIGKETEGNPSWKKTGPLLWSKVVPQHCALPPYTFLPEHHSGMKNKIEGTVYSRQFWGTSKKLYK